VNFQGAAGMKNMMKLHTLTRCWVLLLCTVVMSGCANMYLDNATREVSVSQFKKPDSARPVQALFEFQTKGVANARVSDYLKVQVMEQIKSSGLFSEVSEVPVRGGAMLSITLNNVPITDDAYTKGFVTGLTFGLAGAQVTDGYVCTARYLSDASSPAIVKQARHAIHTTVGNSATPTNATKVADQKEAATTMTRQIISNVLNDLSHDTKFK
jgi:hypothetical protein